MNSRERVFSALAHKQPDRCPTDFWAEQEVIDRLIKDLDVNNEQELLDKLEIDLQFVFPKSTLPPPTILSDGSWYDHMGLHRRRVTTDMYSYVEYASAPFADAEDISELEAYDKWPDPDKFDWENFRDQIAEIHDKRCTKLHAGGMFEYAWPMRGMERFLMDMLVNPEIPHYIMEKLCTYWCGFIKNALDAAGDQIDFVYTYDDIASQENLLISPQLLEEFVYPYHRRVNKLIRSYGKHIIFHSCGSVYSEIDNLKQLPIDFLNPLQPLAKGMGDIESIKNKWGDTLCFHGAIDIQKLLPNGTPEEIRETVRRIISILGKNGGYVMTSAHYIQNDTSTENILAMYDTNIR